MKIYIYPQTSKKLFMGQGAFSYFQRGFFVIFNTINGKLIFLDWLINIKIKNIGGIENHVPARENHNVCWAAYAASLGNQTCPFTLLLDPLLRFFLMV